ncbi:hypothetical protein [Aeromonas phage L9-6]|nr:hypothetical protein [Aeromonas phage L9-6]
MQVTSEMVEELELAAQEVLMDLNSWESNPSTVMGFAYGQGHPVAKAMQKNIDVHGRYTEQIDSSLFESPEAYHAFIAALCNSIPAYFKRFMKCWKEQGPRKASK